ncbi:MULTISPECIES: helix-turn-helix transcriptional regulator [Thermoactinomyces]|uniref:Helix-turn-helix transcriptional regulator n=1 Tax=Thermoactinomyces vulgaris TaxID=2026 RepID=A0ABS0QI18_THEVU|nr:MULTISPECIES: helix-turn-helix transcriptional regulator [Thermoactinomyces]MBH8585728.1 helix-turn-helix transcriptional regulator [Thermoactinomyces sp. CICC 10520]MBI0386774.1 helix-turn-helix transcriptional regulator [Thermoactinomyces sp. CICC 24227]KYQ86852.1 transcriptional regulator [Thermoactinomyces sp. AS95]MBA4550610.1 helix-turn-helix transcriptional regulator [Thermoactinomyces vulgaris]MBA4596331.1 helix-turn-helix transcriptional regulator [Thermoactinomyces vulgaris]
MELTKRQEKILEIVKEEGPITGEHIADKLHLTRATLRPDLAILTMAGFLEARPRVGYFYSGKTANQLMGEHIRHLLVKDYKSRPVVVQEHTSVYDGICTMFLEDVGSLYVIKKEGNLVGVVSRKDLLQAAMGKQELQSMPIGVVMTRMPNIITCKPEDTLYYAAKQMMRHEVDSLPVVRPVDGDEQQLEVIGRISKTTLVKVFVELGQP